MKEDTIKKLENLKEGIDKGNEAKKVDSVDIDYERIHEMIKYETDRNEIRVYKSLMQSFEKHYKDIKEIKEMVTKLANQAGITVVDEKQKQINEHLQKLKELGVEVQR